MNQPLTSTILRTLTWMAISITWEDRRTKDKSNFIVENPELFALWELFDYFKAEVLRKYDVLIPFTKESNVYQLSWKSEYIIDLSLKNNVIAELILFYIDFNRDKNFNGYKNLKRYLSKYHSIDLGWINFDSENATKKTKAITFNIDSIKWSLFRITDFFNNNRQFLSDEINAFMDKKSLKIETWPDWFDEIGSIILLTKIYLSWYNFFITQDIIKNILVSNIVRIIVDKFIFELNEEKWIFTNIKKEIRDEKLKWRIDKLIKKYNFLEIIILLNELHSFSKMAEEVQSILDKNNIIRFNCSQILWREISKSSFRSYMETWLDDEISKYEHWKRDFLRFLIFSDINLFCKWWKFTNQDLFELCESVWEERYENVISLFKITTKNPEVLKYIISNNLENFFNKFNENEIIYLYNLINNWFELEKVLSLSKKAVSFLIYQKVSKVDDFNNFFNLYIEFWDDFENPFHNSKLLVNVERDIKSIDNEETYAKLSKLISDKKLLLLPQEKFLELLRWLYTENYVVDEIRANSSDADLTNVYSDVEWAIELINSLWFWKNSTIIIARIWRLLSIKEREYFCLWLDSYKSEKLLENILQVIKIFKNNKWLSISLEEILDRTTQWISIERLREAVTRLNWNAFRYRNELISYLSSWDEEILNWLFRQKQEVNSNHELDKYLQSVLDRWDDEEIKRVWEKVEELMKNIFRWLDPWNVTSTRHNEFWTWSWWLMVAIRGLIFWKFKKTEKEYYKEYLERIKTINLKRDYINLSNWDVNSNWFLSFLLNLWIDNNKWLFYFLETFWNEILSKFNFWDKDPTELVNYYNQLITEELKTLKRNLNIQ